MEATDALCRAKQVIFEETKLKVELTDGREISVPLVWFPKLMKATEVERNQWRLIAGGVGIHWESLDEDLSVRGLLSHS